MMKFSDEALTAQAGIDGNVKGLWAEIIQYVKARKGFPTSQSLRHKVHRPSDVGTHRVDSWLFDPSW
jgi:hypothetical protein